MRKVVPVLLLSLVLAGCAGTTRWDKPGADGEQASADMVECRQAAQREAFSYYTFPPLPYLGWRGRSLLYWSAWDSDRFFAENRLASFCMRSRGYELVRVPPPPAATTDK